MAPTQQKALLLKSKGAPYEVGTRHVPSPGPGQVLVKIVTTALNPVDVFLQLTGLFLQEYPAVAGSDAAGIIEELGEGVTGLQKGDKVSVLELPVSVPY
jgi:NADPH:quinone reductase-like Zn-dependent oxidoreductase